MPRYSTRYQDTDRGRPDPDLPHDHYLPLARAVARQAAKDGAPLNDLAPLWRYWREYEALRGDRLAHGAP